MKKILQYLKNRKTKLNIKLYKEDINAIIKCEKRCILIFEYIKKSLDRLRHNLDKHQDI